MKTIKPDGIGFLEPLEGSGGWYFGTDYTSGDLYEAEELYRDGHRISKNRLIFVHKKQGRVREPVMAREGQYFGRPVYDSWRIVILLADFPAGEVRLLAFAPGSRTQLQTLAALPLAEIPDCYNLMPHTAPLTLTLYPGTSAPSTLYTMGVVPPLALRGRSSNFTAQPVFALACSER